MSRVKLSTFRYVDSRSLHHNPITEGSDIVYRVIIDVKQCNLIAVSLSQTCKLDFKDNATG